MSKILQYIRNMFKKGEPDEHTKHWDRGPFYDGTCGIGIHQRKRTQRALDKDAPPLNNFEAADHRYRWPLAPDIIEHCNAVADLPEADPDSWARLF